MLSSFNSKHFVFVVLLGDNDQQGKLKMQIMMAGMFTIFSDIVLQNFAGQIDEVIIMLISIFTSRYHGKTYLDVFVMPKKLEMEIVPLCEALRRRTT